MADDRKRATLDVVEDAASTASSARRPRTAAKRSAAKPSARKRSRQIHDTQVRCDFFSDQDLADNYNPPTEMISRMNNDEFYDDPYQDDIDVSFAKLPPEQRYEMLEGIHAMARKVERNTVRATDEDPTAICIPSTHIHEIAELPTGFPQRNDPMAAVKEGHRAELSALHACEVLENYTTEHECYGSSAMSVAAFLDELDACTPHGLQQHDDGSLFIIFELGRRDVFYAAVEVETTDILLPKGDSKYASWTLELMDKIRGKTVAFKWRGYFECPCV